MAQARSADGNLFADARSVDDVQHTLTVWNSETAMKRFLYRGAHRKAIRQADNIGAGNTCGYETAEIPDWETALAHWRQHATDYRTTGIA
ncbi:DUF3291 domain-containing protein [Roseibium hamelinense]|nr:DUF3291 domain-containing protein [Roseibium hamelinense]